MPSTFKTQKCEVTSLLSEFILNISEMENVHCLPVCNYPLAATLPYQDHILKQVTYTDHSDATNPIKSFLYMHTCYMPMLHLHIHRNPQ